MNEIKLTVGLCPEDRARLDNIISLLTTRAAQTQVSIEERLDKQDDVKVQDFLKKTMNLAKETRNEDTPKTAQDEPKVEDHPTLDPFPETPTAKEEPSAETVPAVKRDLSDIQQLIIALSADGKKDKARDVIYSYGVKNASKLKEAYPDDYERVYGEVYDKLAALGVKE